MVFVHVKDRAGKNVFSSYLCAGLGTGDQIPRPGLPTIPLCIREIFNLGFPALRSQNKPVSPGVLSRMILWDSSKPGLLLNPSAAYFLVSPFLCGGEKHQGAKHGPQSHPKPAS